MRRAEHIKLPRALVRFFAVILLSLAVAACKSTRARQVSPPNRPAVRAAAPWQNSAPHFVGSAACADCHRKEFDLWQGSHHQLAMQAATKATVLGDFNGVTVRTDRITATFLRRGEEFMVRTEGFENKAADYTIRFTFGVYPLQQYLVAAPGGRLQALGIAWDARPAKEGGQRWFFLFPDARRGSPIYWTGLDQTWNFMCADCHSTDVHKNYDLRTRSYATTYSEIDVGCEACHGPASNHLVWAKHENGWQALSATQGLTVRYPYGGESPWSIDPATGNPRPKLRNRSFVELNTCARCHSRRSQIKQSYVCGQPVGDEYRVSLLGQDRYFTDGQIKAEDYEYGSFLQSRMYHSGVRCSDCHDPHSLKLYATGNMVCLRCHAAQKYDSISHHHHKPDTAGSRCVECHMPTRTYMIVHQRHDHSLRVPRPDLSVSLGVPNPCNQCHRDKSAKWAAAAIARWDGTRPAGYQHYAHALAAGAEGAPAAAQSLAALAANREQPAIARATAISLLAAYPGPAATLAVRNGARDSDPLVRRAAAAAVSAVPAADATRILAELLGDPVRDVRVESASSAALNRLAANPGVAGASLERANAEYVAAQELNDDRPEAHVNLGLFYAAQNQPQRAIKELRIARELDPAFAPAAVDLADLFRQHNRDGEAGAVLADGLRRSPRNPELLHAMGLYLVRAHRYPEALKDLADAARIAPENARYGYVYAVALNDTGSTAAALVELKRVLTVHPYDRDSLSAIVAIYASRGDRRRALEYAQRLQVLDPDDPALKLELDRLRSEP